jgi:hypothetical protein
MTGFQFGNFRMKYLALAGLTAMVLSGCMGPDGNPDGQPYANEPGGAIAAPPQMNGIATYNPESQAPQSSDTTAIMGMPATPKTPMPAPPPKN